MQTASHLNPQRVAVTGATGFIGHAVVASLQEHGDIVPVRCVRQAGNVPTAGGAETRVVGKVNAGTDWSDALRGCDAIIHAAGRAHILRETEQNAERAFQEINVQGTRRLAEQAVEAGVKRFIFLSSIGVHGTETVDAPLREDSDLRPENAYARSKRDAEEALLEVSAVTDLETVIVRPPLVYGPGSVPGNFGRLVRLVKSGAPLPFASIRNRRSFVARANLVDFLLTTLTHPEAANQTFLVSDDDDCSTPDFVRAIAHGLGRQARLLPCHTTLLNRALNLAGRGNMARQLCSSLQIDISLAKHRLGWQPPLTMRAAMKAALSSS